MTEVPVMRAVELVRQRPDMFFEGGRATMSQLISLVLRDAACFEHFTVQIHRDGPYAMVSSDCDWMATERARLEELFDRFVLPLPARPNSHRSEVLLIAVCEGVLTLGASGNFSSGLKITDVPAALASLARTAVRAFIWKFEE